MDNRSESSALTKAVPPRQHDDIESLYEYVRRRDEGEHGFRASIAAMYERNARWSNPALTLAVIALGKMLEPAAGSVKYFFWGSKFEEIILGLPKDEVCVIGGPKQLKFCLKNRIRFIPHTSLWKTLANGLAHERRQNSDPEIEKNIRKFGNLLKKMASEKCVLIVDNDSLPMQRSMILAGRRAGLESICIQDGIFSSKSPGHIMHGWHADQFLAFNEQQKSMLAYKGMNPQKIKVMGFYSSPYTLKRTTAPAGQRKICFLGQPWNKYGAERAKLYLEIVNKTASTLSAKGIAMNYKPHPWERGSVHLQNIENVIDVTLHDALEHHDVFISLTSTALIEAQAAGRVAIQIMHDVFDADDLSAHGKIISIDATNNKNWQNILSNSIDAPTFEKEHNKIPAEKFIEALECQA